MSGKKAQVSDKKCQPPSRDFEAYKFRFIEGKRGFGFAVGKLSQ